jgi:putative phosphoribosyl transferase
MFADRSEAGKLLAEALRGRVSPDAVVLGVPRGGVVVAAEVARSLGLPLDVVVVRKLGAPGNPEYAVGAVDEDGRVVGGTSAIVSEAYLQDAARVGREEIARRLRVYRQGRAPLDVSGREVVLVDDGIATGMTLMAALDSLRRRGASRIVVATPVAAPDAAHHFRMQADEFVTLLEPPGFGAVGQFYTTFEQTDDAEVIELLRTTP